MCCATSLFGSCYCTTQNCVLIGPAVHLLALGTGLGVHRTNLQVRYNLRTIAILQPPPPKLLDIAPAARSSIVEIVWF